MKNVVVYFQTKGLKGYPFTYEKYLSAYINLRDLLIEKDCKMYIARGDDAYLGDSKFKNISFLNEESRPEELDETILADIVFDKRDSYTSDLPGVVKTNDAEIDLMCADKDLTAQKFGKYMPKSFTANNPREYSEFLSQVTTMRAVIKPPIGYSGDGIIISEIEDLRKLKDTTDFPVIIQEFVDTSRGIPELTDTYHDLRVVIIEGEIVQCSIRTPAEGSLIANVALGGSIKFIDIEDIPEGAKEMALKIDSELSKYERRVLSVDMIFDGEKYWMLELNSRPGVNPLSGEPKIDLYLTTIAELLAR